MKDEHDLYWIWAATKFGVASKEFAKIADKFASPYDIYRLTEEELEQIPGLGKNVRDKLCDKSIESAYSIIKTCRKYKIDIIGYGDARYPARLRTIENPPVVIYCLGKIPDMNSRLCIGAVGTRKMSEYGKQTAYKICYELAAANAIVVSGMALGIDSVCACGALEAGGCTVAVLGCGVLVTYPKEHEKLKRIIAKRGAVISEYPPFASPDAANFPKRNRIISGLCQGVLVVEGAKGSGALITASKAISQGRELFAVPGNVGQSNSDGPNELIQNGANVALCAKDILDNFGFLYGDVINYGRLNAAAKRSGIDDGILKKYGVSSVYYKGRFTQSTAQGTVPSADIKLRLPKSEPISEPIPQEPSFNAAYEALDEVGKKIYDILPTDKAFAPDALAADGMSISDIIGTLTILEINGLVKSLPGGMFRRA